MLAESMTRVLLTANRSRPCNFVRRAHETSYQQPAAPAPANNPHRAFWKTFGRPIGKVFLGAMFTYQVLYWTWLKLESVETETVNDAETRVLEARLESLQRRLAEAASEK